MPRRSACKMAADRDNGRFCMYTCMLCLQKTFSRQEGASLTSLTFVVLGLSSDFREVYHTDGFALLFFIGEIDIKCSNNPNIHRKLTTIKLKLLYGVKVPIWVLNIWPPDVHLYSIC